MPVRPKRLKRNLCGLIHEELRLMSMGGKHIVDRSHD